MGSLRRGITTGGPVSSAGPYSDDSTRRSWAADRETSTISDEKRRVTSDAITQWGPTHPLAQHGIIQTGSACSVEHSCR